MSKKKTENGMKNDQSNKSERTTIKYLWISLHNVVQTIFNCGRLLWGISMLWHTAFDFYEIYTKIRGKTSICKAFPSVWRRWSTHFKDLEIGN